MEKNTAVFLMPEELVDLNWFVVNWKKINRVLKNGQKPNDDYTESINLKYGFDNDVQMVLVDSKPALLPEERRKSLARNRRSIKSAKKV